MKFRPPELGLKIPDSHVPQEFRQRVNQEIAQAQAGAFEIMPLPEQKAKPMPKVTTVKEFQCKWVGCYNIVTTNKNMGAYCVEIQENGKTHRQMFLEGKREEDPDYMRRGRHLPPRDSREPTLPPPKPADIARSNGGISWLGETRASLLAAMQQVEQAEHELDQAKERLRTILDEARTALG